MIRRVAAAAGVVLAVALTELAGAPHAEAMAPMRLTAQLTDVVGDLTPSGHELTPSGRVDVQAALDKLYADRGVRLWVVYVDRFSSKDGTYDADPMTWTTATWEATGLGGADVLLAMSMSDDTGTVKVSPAILGLTQDQLNNLWNNKISSELHNGQVAKAAKDMANGLNELSVSPGQSITPPDSTQITTDRPPGYMPPDPNHRLNMALVDKVLIGVAVGIVLAILWIETRPTGHWAHRRSHQVLPLRGSTKVNPFAAAVALAGAAVGALGGVLVAGMSETVPAIRPKQIIGLGLLGLMVWGLIAFMRRGKGPRRLGSDFASASHAEGRGRIPADTTTRLVRGSFESNFPSPCQLRATFRWRISRPARRDDQRTTRRTIDS